MLFDSTKTPPEPEGPEPVALDPQDTGSRAPNYVVLRQGSTSPEPLWAQSDEEATGIVRRQVRSGQTAIVRLYKLMCAEVFVPSSDTLTPEQLKEKLTSRDAGDAAPSGK